MVKREIKPKDGTRKDSTYNGGPGGVKGNTALPYHGNTEHPHSSGTENTTEKRGGRKSNRRKKSMKKKGKTAKKRKTKKARKTKRRKVAGAPGIFTGMYRKAHNLTGKHSKGEQREIDDAAKAAKAAADLVELQKLRKDEYYTEVNDIEEFKVGSTYVKFQGAGAELKNLGQFKREWEMGANYGVIDVTLEFENGKLGGFSRVRGGEGGRRGTGWTTVDNVFKVNYDAILSDQNKNFDIKNDQEEGPKEKMKIQGLNDDVQNRIAEFVKGGRKRKTRKTKKSRRARN
jgi:hypothetical protein